MQLVTKSLQIICCMFELTRGKQKNYKQLVIEMLVIAKRLLLDATIFLLYPGTNSNFSTPLLL
jgi:hypothetical protein